MVTSTQLSHINMLYEEIASFFNKDELKSVSTVNKIWYKTTLNCWIKQQKKITSKTLKRKIELFSKITMQKTPIEGFSASFIYCEIHFYPEDLQNNVLLACLSKLNIKNACLKSNFTTLCLSHLQTFIQWFPNILYLSIESHPIRPLEISKEKCKLRKLKAQHIRLHDFHVREKLVDSLPPFLEGILISHSTITKKAFSALSKLPLKSINLYACNFDSSWFKMLENVTSLESLALEGSICVKYQDIKNLIEANPSIRRLAIDEIIFYSRRRIIEIDFPNIHFFSTRKKLPGLRRKTI